MINGVKEEVVICTKVERFETSSNQNTCLYNFFEIWRVTVTIMIEKEEVAISYYLMIPYSEWWKILVFHQKDEQETLNFLMHLRPWQEEALKLFNVPSERQVIWIVGCQGYEGKSWFQNYVEAYFGYQRVARIDLRIKHANVCNVLKKRSQRIREDLVCTGSYCRK